MKCNVTFVNGPEEWGPNSRIVKSTVHRTAYESQLSTSIKQAMKCKKCGKILIVIASLSAACEHSCGGKFKPIGGW